MARATAQNTAKTPPRPRLAELSFVSKRKLMPRERSQYYWDVKATGDYGLDCETGRRMALEYLAFEEADQRNGTWFGTLQHIVEGMPRPMTGVEIGFLIMVCRAAGAGAHEARRLSAYWDQMEAERLTAAAVKAPVSSDRARRSQRRS